MRIMKDGIFLTLQGEGLLTGVPSVFIRTAGCDLRCNRADDGAGWACDTPKSLPDFNRSRGKLTVLPTKYAEDSDWLTVASKAMSYGVKHIVITGGEPTLQYADLCRVVAHLLSAGRHVTIETNARHYILEAAYWAKDQFLVSLSPKVYTPGAVDITEYEKWCRNVENVQVKIVLSDVSRLEEAVQLFRAARYWNAKAALFVQRADTAAPAGLIEHEHHALVVAQAVIHDPDLRSLDVRYGVQTHKTIGIP